MRTIFDHPTVEGLVVALSGETGKRRTMDAIPRVADGDSSLELLHPFQRGFVLQQMVSNDDAVTCCRSCFGFAATSTWTRSIALSFRSSVVTRRR